MSDGNRDAPKPDLPDLAEAPFLDEEERAESAWLIARDRDPSAPPPSPTLQREYAALEDLLGDLPVLAKDEAWNQEVLRRIKAENPPRPVADALAAAPAAEVTPPPPAVNATTTRGAPLPFLRRSAYWAAGAALVAAAAVLTIVLVRPGEHASSPELQLEIRRGDQVRGDPTEAAVGDTLVIRGRLLATSNLRVFRADGTPVARCPEGPECRLGADGERSLELQLDRPTAYRVILVTGATGSLPGGTLSEYYDAVRAAKGHISLERLIEVR